MLRASMISVPPAAGTSEAWWREARTSGMTMSLSLARPIFTAPGGDSGARPGRRILSMLVARLPPSPERGAAVGPIRVTGSSPAWSDIGGDISGDIGGGIAAPAAGGRVRGCGPDG